MGKCTVIRDRMSFVEHKAWIVADDLTSTAPPVILDGDLPEYRRDQKLAKGNGLMRDKSGGH